jgi:hypothetical protein
MVSKSTNQKIDNDFDLGDPYELTYPSSRQLTFDLGKLGVGRHHVKGLLKIDVTDARVKIRELRRSDKNVSFSAWLLKTSADCVAAHPPVNGFRRGNEVVVYKDVDIALALERELEGKLVPLAYVIRNVNGKSVTEIHREIQSAKSIQVGNEGEIVLGENYFWMKLFISLPQWLRLIFWRAFFFTNPQWMKDMMGNMMVTTVGLVGHVRGWIIPFTMHPLCLAFGSVTEEPGVFKGEIQKREYLHLCTLIDHDVIDGSPAARFVDDLVRKLEKATGI